MLTVAYDDNVALICLSDDRDEIDHYADMVPTDDDPLWEVHLLAHNKGISPALAKNFREMARDGVPFVGRHAHMLGIATDFGGELQ